MLSRLSGARQADGKQVIDMMSWMTDAVSPVIELVKLMVGTRCVKCLARAELVKLMEGTHCER